MPILLVAEHDNAALDEATRRSLTAALAIGAEVDLLVAGNDAQAVADQAARLQGVRKVLHADGAVYKHPLAEELSALVVALAGAYDVIVAPATASGKNLLPRVAALLDVMQISEIVEVVSSDTFKRPIYAGNAIQTVQSLDVKKVVTVRSSAFEAAAEGAAPAPVEAIEASASRGLSRLLGTELSARDRPDLASARIVISGGRALGSAEKFNEILLPLADKLGAALGASRAAVDAGYVPNDFQVGQTGKIVAPDLYIAIGISGAIQHLAGMKASKVIVAINKDADAPIFQVADYGLVADIFEAVPELTSRL